MNEEQLSKPADMADEQNQESDAGTGAEMSADADNSSEAGNGTDANNVSDGDTAMADGGQTEARSETAEVADEVAGNGLADEPVAALEIEEASEAIMPEADSSPAIGEDIPAEAISEDIPTETPAQSMAEAEPAGDEPVAEQPLDNQPSGDEPAGDPAEQPVGEPPTQDQPIGEPPTREQPMGEPPAGDMPMGDRPPGDQPRGDGPMGGGDRDGGPARFQRPYQDEGSDEAPPELVVRPARDPNMENVASDASMEDLMKASAQQYRTLKHGDVLEGTVMKVDREEILLDIGAKTEGVIPAREATSMTEEERSALKIGDEVLVSVLQPENSEGHAVLSVDRARQERAWRDLHKQYEAGEIIQAQVVGHNKGGLLVNLEGIRGFVPSSQISSMPPGEANKQAELARLHSSTMPLKIIEINRNRNRLILSERQAMQEQRESMRSRLLQELEPGQIRPGTVTSICDFGAFVDIGGADGLIHLSELSWKRVSHPSELLKPGERIDVYVLSVDPNERKIALSLKRTQPEPWDTITDQYQLGQVVHGTITQITSFGAFARLEDGIEGLIHVSELAEGRVAHPRNVVKEGDAMDLKVIRIDPARKRIGLSLKRMTEGAEGGEGAGEEGMSGEMRADTAQTGGEGGESEGGYTPPTPSRERQFERGATQEREQRQSQARQEKQDRQQKAPVSSASFNVPEDDAPSGALAAALAAHAQRGRAAEETEGEEATDTETALKQTDVLTDPGSEANVTDTLTESEAEADETGTPYTDDTDTDTETASSDEPEAMMPSAADTDEVTSTPADMPEADTSDDSGASDTGAASGSEGMPSTSDSDGQSSDTTDAADVDASTDDDTPSTTIDDRGPDTAVDEISMDVSGTADEASTDTGSEEMSTPTEEPAGGDTSDAIDATEEAAGDIGSDTTGMENSDGGNYAENAAEAATDSQSDPEEMSSVAGSEDLGEENEENEKTKGKRGKKEA